MVEALWKVAEKKIARLFGTEREGPRGLNCPDAISRSFSIEVKNRKRLPLWLKDAVEQSHVNGEKWASDRLPIVVVHEKDMDYAKSFVIVRVDDFIEWFGT